DRIEEVRASRGIAQEAPVLVLPQLCVARPRRLRRLERERAERDRARREWKKRAWLRTRQKAKQSQPRAPHSQLPFEGGSAAQAGRAGAADRARAGRVAPPKRATGDQLGLAGGRGGASEANAPAPCTTRPPTIVSSDSSLGISPA